MARIRLDQLLTERGLARSRAEAQSLIHAGAVELDGTRRLKPGQLVAGDASVSLVEKPRWASRAGTKLEHALEARGIEASSVEGSRDYGKDSGDGHQASWGVGERSRLSRRFAAWRNTCNAPAR